MRLIGIAALTAAAMSAFGQTQANLSPATDAAKSVAAGFMYRVDLKTTLSGTFFWEFKVAQDNMVDTLVRVKANPVSVVRSRVISTNLNAPRAGSVDPVTAGMNAVAAAVPSYGDTQIVRFEARKRSDGSVRYRVLLNILADGGGALDQDLDVTLDAAGKVIKIALNDD
jgi:hypothetical protein